ncbi:sulfite oxidase [Oxalobacteraceae bacterium R-40]|uniref:Sulfite oxidase n=1 Tax=Keguizhuia sedimenti TaxID=3064264 RepID=A0ABU1BRF8_9BURK|nr:sulfite oxidase [Oxalobacteraceae bacterium R-40]
MLSSPRIPERNVTDPGRRRLLGGAIGTFAIGLGGFSQTALAQTVAATGTPVPASKPLPQYTAWKEADALIVHSSNTLETRRSAYGSGVITPADRLFVRNNVPPPDPSIVADPDAWTVAIEGVKNPRSLSVAELKGMGLETTAAVLQCSGNGRGFFPSKPSGTPWTVGAAGCVIWSGVPVRSLAQALGGPVEGVVYMTGTGGEAIPQGVDPKSVLVERSVPIKAMEDALLAWEMNGEPVPLAHGGPLRLVVPGYSGVNNIKYIKRLAFTPKQSDARIMESRYRMTPPGEKGNPNQASIWEMGVKSWITSPGTDGEQMKAGRHMIEGVAFGGTNAVKSVEVSVDGGRTWQEARLVGPDLGRFAWRQFALPVDLRPGSYVLASRATDVNGKVQDELRIDNSAGYNNTSWRDHALPVMVA